MINLRIFWNQQKLIFKTLLLLCGISFLVVLLLVYNHLHDKNQIVQEAKNHAKREAVRAAKQIDNDLRKLVPLAQSLADDLSSGKLKKEQLVDRLKSTVEMNPYIFGFGVAYVPYAYDANVRLYAPYYVKRHEKLQLVQVEDFYDYTEPQHDWYHLPLADGPCWQEPYFGEASASLLAEFTTPFYRIDASSQERIPAGVVYIDYSLNDVNNVNSG